MVGHRKPFRFLYLKKKFLHVLSLFTFLCSPLVYNLVTNRKLSIRSELLSPDMLQSTGASVWMQSARQRAAETHRITEHHSLLNTAKHNMEALDVL